MTLGDGRRLRCRKLLIATGVVDQVPDVPGAREMYGRSVFHCPYCDGWEIRDQPVAVYGRRLDAANLALGLTNWTRDVVLLTDGRSRMNRERRDRLARNGIASAGGARGAARRAGRPARARGLPAR